MTNTTNSQRVTSDLMVAALCSDPKLNFWLEDGIGSIMEWYQSPMGLFRFYWEDEEALMWGLVQWVSPESKVMKRKITGSNLDLPTFRAVVAAFIGA